MENMGINDFWKGRRVLVTGGTGFKGSWLLLWLEKLGAVICNVALKPEPTPSLYEKLAPWSGKDHNFLDIRDLIALCECMVAFRPEIVLHLAAQALVRRSFEDPIGTLSTNILGTANVLEAVRQTGTVKTIIVLTSDKVYANNESGLPFAETSTLGGRDPYSASKACAELVCQSYRDSFLRDSDIRLATARAGNVIGGGDWSKDRLVPDIVRAFLSGEKPRLRYPAAVRPWQHVLEPLRGYLLYAQALTEASSADLPNALNFGPSPTSFASVSQITETFSSTFELPTGWELDHGAKVPEASFLTLDSELARRSIEWCPQLDLQKTIEWTASWYKAERDGADMREFTLRQIEAYEEVVS